MDNTYVTPSFTHHQAEVTAQKRAASRFERRSEWLQSVLVALCNHISTGGAGSWTNERMQAVLAAGVSGDAAADKSPSASADGPGGEEAAAAATEEEAEPEEAPEEAALRIAAECAK